MAKPDIRTNVEVKGTKAICGEICNKTHHFRDDACVTYEQWDTEDGRLPGITIKIEQLAPDELAKMEEIDFGKTEPAGNYGREAARKTPRGGVKITITREVMKLGKRVDEYTETKIVTYG